MIMSIKDKLLKEYIVTGDSEVLAKYLKVCKEAHK